MIQFAEPWWLLLTPAVPAVVWLWLRQRRGALRYSATGLFAGLPEGRSRAARWGGALLRGAALVLLVVGLAGPRLADRHTRIPTEGIAIEVVLDVSGSMATRDFDWQGRPISRLDAARRAFRLFVAGGDGPDGEHLDGRPNDLVGLVTFATWPDSRCPLTLSHGVLLRLLDAEQPRSVPGESETNLSDALAVGLQRLESARVRRKVLVLITDGEHNVPHSQSAWSPRQAAQVAASLRVPVYAIDAGGESGVDDELGRAAATDPVARARVRASAEKTLQTVASITGGRYYRARDTAGLLAVCREIDRLERQAIQSFQYQRYTETFPVFGVAAFVALVVLQVMELTVWQRVP